MTGWLVAAIVLASIAAYLAMGWWLAMRDLPQAQIRARRHWHYNDTIRSSVKEQTVSMCLVWPVLSPLRAFSCRLDEAIDARDPDLLAAKVAERDQRIAQLERELGMRRP